MDLKYMTSTIYVSVHGDDHNNGYYQEDLGRRNGPKRTIESAVAQCRSIYVLTGDFRPMTIQLLDEEYPITKPIVLPAGFLNITIEPRTKTLISGGVQIKSFRHDVFNGVKCFSADVKHLLDQGIWFTDLYVDREHASFTRYPQEGTLDPVDVENHEPFHTASSTWFIAKPEDLVVIKDFRNFGDCIISYNHAWVDEHTPIHSYDLDTGKITFEYASRFSISDAFHSAFPLHYVIENVAEAFRNPNEWYLDREYGKVYYIPRNESQTPENITVYAPLVKHLFVFDGNRENPIENVHLRNLELAYTTGDYFSVTGTTDGIVGNIKYASDGQSVCAAHGAIEMNYAHHCSIENCNLHCLGVHGIHLNMGCQSNRIFNNRITNLGGGGISAWGDNNRKNLPDHNCRNQYANNTLRSMGRRYYAACGILLRHTYENTVSHNEISDLYYSGISLGWVWGYMDSISENNILEYNHIFNVGQGKLSDMGGIYTLGKLKGTVIRNNLIHDVKSCHYGGIGIYTDEGSSYLTIENNICYNLTSYGINQHFGHMNVVKNNIFAHSRSAPVCIGKNEPHVGAVFERNILVSDGESFFRIGNSMGPNSCRCLYSQENLLYSRQETAIPALEIAKSDDFPAHYFTLEEMKEQLDAERNSRMADPLFKDLDNYDFTLAENSPAFDLGFKPIDMSTVGPQEV